MPRAPLKCRQSDIEKCRLYYRGAKIIDLLSIYNFESLFNVPLCARRDFVLLSTPRMFVFHSCEYVTIDKGLQKFRPLLGAPGLWMERGLYCVTPVVIWCLEFCDLIQRIASLYSFKGLPLSTRKGFWWPIGKMTDLVIWKPFRKTSVTNLLSVIKEALAI
jgi:hypothetical protein